MIERFHRFLKASLHARAADSDWASHLPLVLLSLCSVPKEEFLDTPELPSSQFSSKMEKVVTGFSIPLPHHVPLSSPTGFQVALKDSKFVFV